MKKDDFEAVTDEKEIEELENNYVVDTDATVEDASKDNLLKTLGKKAKSIVTNPKVIIGGLALGGTVLLIKLATADNSNTIEVLDIEEIENDEFAVTENIEDSAE